MNSDHDLFCSKCQSELLIEGQYRAIKLLGGKGLYCDTYEIIDLEQGIHKVLKLLKENDPKLIELFNREFEALHTSNHPGIPRSEVRFEFPMKDGSTPALCLVMQKIEGMNLEDVIEQKGSPISQNVAIKWMQQLTLIIQEIHSHNLFHRDIKPPNIMLQNDGRLVLIDFGAVGLISNVSSHPRGTVIYTQNYAAPEQLQGSAVPQSDFFSLGRTFVHLLTGHAISTLKTGSSNLIVTGETSQPLQWHQYASHLSPALIALLDNLMAERVEHRPAHPTEILRRLAAIEESSRNEIHDQIAPTEIVTPLSERHSRSDTDLPVVSTPPTEIIIPFSDPRYQINPTEPIQPRSRLPIKLGLLAAVLSIGGLLVYGINSLTLKPSPTGGSQQPSPPPVAQQCSSTQLVKQSGKNLFGVIEIGSSGVKGEVVQELNAPNSAGHTLEPREEDIEAKDVNPINPNAKQQTVQAVKDMFLDIQQRFGIPCEHIVIYGSSGFATKTDLAYRDSLIGDIQTTIGRAVEVISPEQEATYVFSAIVPPHRLDQVLMLDIGSGNTKGAFQNANGSAQSPGTFSFPWGTKTFTEEVDRIRGSQDFVTALTRLREQILPDFRQRTRLLPILASKPRVYLTGGIVWSLATLVRPCQPEQVIAKEAELSSEFVRLYPEDLTTFYNNVTRDQKTLFEPDLSQCTEEQRVRVKKDIAKIRNEVFTTEELTGGAELLRVLSSSLKFVDKDAIFFSRYAFEALPIGFLKEKIDSAEEAKG
ncbi:MAG: protein kinase [Acaryochloris sp. RU_4_1]|nr:protein kinase [Acaryochloris sp. RU_4_1]